jgi:sensor histidine kinase YesM
MRNKFYYIYLTGACLISGAVVFAYLTSRSIHISESILIGLFFSVILFIILYFIHESFITKLRVFSGFQAIFYQSFLYIIALTFTCLLTFVFFTLMKATRSEIEDIMYEGVIRGFLYIITLPFSDDQSTQMINPQIRNMMFTLPMMIFLIGIVSIISSFIQIKWKEIKQKQLISDAELKALQAQIEPHFLFNSLNTIVSIVKSDPNKAQTLLIKLSDLLHYLFTIGNKLQISLKDELIFTKNYLSLMQARYPDSLHVNWDQNDINDHLSVPALLFQPVIENAIKHGWQDKTKDLLISVIIKSLNNFIEIEIKDNGIGISKEKIMIIPIQGHAIENLSERLFLEYQKKDLIQIDSQPGKGTNVKIKIPVNL